MAYYESWKKGEYAPVGGGFVRHSFPEDVVITPIKSLPNDLLVGRCSIDGGREYACLCNPVDRWNGWAKPLLFANQIPLLREELDGDGDNFYHTSMEGDTLVIKNDDGEVEKIACEDGLYDFSNLGWCWDFTRGIKELIDHILAMENDAYLTGHPEWEAIVAEAKQIKL